MRADAIIKHEGMTALFSSLNLVEAERFIALVKRTDFDYTEWRKTLWEDETIGEISRKAMEFQEKQK